MNAKIKFFLTLGTFGLFSVQSCTNLDEEVYDQVTPDEFGQNQEQLDALIGPIYSGLGDYFANMNDLSGPPFPTVCVAVSFVLLGSVAEPE